MWEWYGKKPDIPDSVQYVLDVLVLITSNKVNLFKSQLFIIVDLVASEITFSSLTRFSLNFFWKKTKLILIILCFLGIWNWNLLNGFTTTSVKNSKDSGVPR